ncbi:hypothetical protein BDB01DRAFT_833193 [Pilobolus umbonatus]|nr:hypothetical protein BDB01DRAFT_833193 [Pilobolus umbonatus]
MLTEVTTKTNLYNVIQEKQFYWWIGHVIVVFNGLFYFSSVLSLNSNPIYYRIAYLGAILSYAVVIYNSIGLNNRDIDINLFCDENVHYLAIAFYWYSYQPIADQRIQSFTDNYHKSALYYVAYTEVTIIMSRLILGVISFTTSILALIVYIHFLRLRYYISPQTREAVHMTSHQLDQWFIYTYKGTHSPVDNARIVLSNIYISIKKMIIKYGDIKSYVSLKTTRD